MKQRPYDEIRDNIKLKWNEFIKDHVNDFQEICNSSEKESFDALDHLQSLIKKDLYVSRLSGLWITPKNVSIEIFSRYLKIFKDVLSVCIKTMNAIRKILIANAEKNKIAGEELRLYDIKFEETFNVPNELNIDIDPQSGNKFYWINLENTLKMKTQLQTLWNISEIFDLKDMSLDCLEFNYKKCKKGKDAAEELLKTMLNKITSTERSGLLQTKAHYLLCEISRQVHGFLV